MRREESLQVNLEPHIFEVTKQVAKALDKSASAYIRELILKDLLARNAVTAQDLVELAMAS